MDRPTDNARIDELFAAALDLPADERPAFLDRSCEGDQEPGVREAVEQLLRLSAEEDLGSDLSELRRGGLLRELARSAPGSAGPDVESSEEGSRIGEYRVVGEIGRGGMGVVYLAERVEGDFEQRVAIKILRAGLGGEALERRFEEERTILASLNHPHVARLYGGGRTSDGRPYFTMEYVEGLPIDRYCDERQLTVDQRLELFAKVIGAVHYAHRNLVIHRDIKPTNVLVGGDGEPKLLDFGIAKLADEEGVGEGTTRKLERRLTPEVLEPRAAARRERDYRIGRLSAGALALRAPDRKLRPPGPRLGPQVRLGGGRVHHRAADAE